jgi:hypothetical protein
MIRPLGALSLMAALAVPAAAADLPTVYNLPTDLPKLMAGQAPPGTPPPAAPPVKLPEIINLSAAGGPARPAVARVAADPGIGLILPGPNVSAYGGLVAPYYAAALVSGYGFAPFAPFAPLYGYGYGYGWGYNYNLGYGYGIAPVIPPQAYFAGYTPAGFLYRDITTRPLGRAFRIPVGGLAVPNPPGVLLPAGPYFW